MEADGHHNLESHTAFEWNLTAAEWKFILCYSTTAVEWNIQAKSYSTIELNPAAAEWKYSSCYNTTAVNWNSQAFGTTLVCSVCGQPVPSAL